MQAKQDMFSAKNRYSRGLSLKALDMGNSTSPEDAQVRRLELKISEREATIGRLKASNSRLELELERAHAEWSVDRAKLLARERADQELRREFNKLKLERDLAIGQRCTGGKTWQDAYYDALAHVQELERQITTIIRQYHELKSERDHLFADREVLLKRVAKIIEAGAK